jgi:protein TonB
MTPTRLAICLLTLLFLAGYSPASEKPTAYDEPPRLVKGGQPKYPAGPFREGVEGTVLIEFTVNEKGDPTDLKVVESIAGLDQAALDCVKKWRFSPAKKAGKPVAAQANAPVTFRITGKKDSK